MIAISVSRCFEGVYKHKMLDHEFCGLYLTVAEAVGPV